MPALVRAPLVHFYYELIHPFWDGNRRVGRLIEAAVLHAAGYRYAPFAMARYYLGEMDRYFTLFNHCRTLAEKSHPTPNQPFVEFHIEGVRHTIDSLHARVDQMVSALLFEARLRRAFDGKAINARQFTLVSQVLQASGGVPLDALRRAPWYESLYLKLNDKTRTRDLAKLRALGFLHQDDHKRLWPGMGAKSASCPM